MTDLALAAPNRDRASLPLLATALFAVPCLWALRLVVNYGIDSHFCFPGESRRNVLPAWAWPTLLGIDVATIAVAIIAILISFHYWRRARDEAVAHAALIETGEGPTRFFAVMGPACRFWFSGCSAVRSGRLVDRAGMRMMGNRQSSLGQPGFRDLAVCGRLRATRRLR